MLHNLRLVQHQSIKIRRPTNQYAVCYHVLVKSLVKHVDYVLCISNSLFNLTDH